MKVSMNVDGIELKIDGELNEAVDFVKKLREKETEHAQSIERINRIEKAVELNAVQFELWEYLVDNDCEAGIPIAAVARHFNDSESKMGQRLVRLCDTGYAYRVGRGRYRWSEKN